MKILITGGAGFIGSHVADRYLAEGHEVAVIDDLSAGTRSNLPPEAVFYKCDIRDAAAVERVFSEYRPEVVSHHAAQLNVRKAIDDPGYDAAVNVIGGLNVLTNAVRTGTQRLIFASTGGAIYGEPEQIPVLETAPKQPKSPYGLTKGTFEAYLRLWQQLHGIKFVILRYSNVYGPRQGAHGEAGVVAVFSRLLLQGEPCTIFGDGSSARDYVYVDDVVEANRLALSRGDGEIMNIGTGRLTRIDEVFTSLRDALGIPDAEVRHIPARPGEVHRISLDTTLARAVLGWQPQVAFADGVVRTAEWLRNNPFD